MKQYNGFKSEAPATGYAMLPAGAYVCGIKNVKIDGAEPDQQLVLRLEIIEGEYAGYYTKRYEHDSQNAGYNQKYAAKYKGDYRLQVTLLFRKKEAPDVKTDKYVSANFVFSLE
jgi:hypothetical protein